MDSEIQGENVISPKAEQDDEISRIIANYKRKMVFGKTPPI